jgi:hypothetical protein
VHRGQRFGVPAVVACATLLFYTNYFTAVGLLLALTVAAPLYDCTWPFFRRLAAAGLLTAALVLPGVAYFHVLGKAHPLHFAGFVGQLGEYAAWFVTFLLPLPVLLLLLAVRLKDWQPADAAANRAVHFLAALCAVYLLYLPLAPWDHFRYLAVLLPLTAVLLGWVTFRVLRWSRPAGVALVLVLIGTDAVYQFPVDSLHAAAVRRADRFPSVGGACLSLGGYLYEVTHPVNDPEWVLSQYLRAHARPTDVVVITYGDLPLQFYTGLKVVGGLQGRPVPPDPDWIILRRTWVTPRAGGDVDVMRYVYKHVNPDGYVVVDCHCAEVMMGNDPDPLHHVFRAPAREVDVAVLHKRQRPGAEVTLRVITRARPCRMMVQACSTPVHGLKRAARYFHP